MRVFGCYYHIWRKNDNLTVGSGTGGIQVHSGHVKMLKKLFKELELHILNQI